MDPLAVIGKDAVDGLRDLDELFGRSGTRYAVVGATGILLQGIELERSTRDLDLAVSVTTNITQLRTLLEANGFRKATAGQTFVTAAGVEVDVLPVRTASPSARVEFPGGDTISQVGLVECIERANPVSLDRGHALVAPVSLLAAVKLLTATARVSMHDLEDAQAILAQYESAGSRRFEIDYTVEEELSWEVAGAWLVGIDARCLLLESSRVVVLQAIEKLLLDSRLSDRYASGPQNRALIEAFRRALTRRGSAADVAGQSAVER